MPLPTGCSSLNVVLGQSGSGQPQTRLAHSRHTGFPKQGMSRSRSWRRPWPTATTPHSKQPPSSWPDSTPRAKPALVAVTEWTSMPSTPSSASAPAAMGTRHRVIHVSVSFWFWLLGRYQFKRPCPLPAALRRSAECLRDGAVLRHCIHAYLRRPDQWRHRDYPLNSARLPQLQQ